MELIRKRVVGWVPAVAVVGRVVSISGLLEAVAAASGTNPGAVEKEETEAAPTATELVQELLRKWVTKENVLEREGGGMDCERERERERESERSDGREEGGSEGGRGRWCSAVQLGGAITSATYHTRETDKAAVNALINTTSACLHAARTYLPAPYPPTYLPTYLPLQFYHSFLPRPARYVGRRLLGR
jgi:hypothetical protein